MSLKALKYLTVLSLPLTVAVSFCRTDAWVFLPLLYAFGLVPLVELLVKPSAANLQDAEKELAKENPVYDVLVRLMVPLQWAFLLWFVKVIQDPSLSGMALAGRITAMGMLCGVVGINVAHELGHRQLSLDRFLAKTLLLSTLYTHFYIEHNRGHHRHVATPDDPASARQGETLYAFWFRALPGAWWNAWKLENERMKKEGRTTWSMQNEMLRLQIIQAVLIAVIAVFAGGNAAVYFVLASLMGGLLLETVNYIEHYGLLRKRNERGRYERVMPIHSWNSNHVFGRVLLFELTRHSDHHYKASKPYQLLDHMDEAPQLPTGYPGMMLLALVPPLFFSVMDPKVDKLRVQTA